jgi:L-alanine-DL-glutamate epimerase-like enolase superfamily enzyme
MMSRKPSDIRVESVDVRFSVEPLTVPLQLSKGASTEFTYAKAVVAISTRDGRRGEGFGSILLSDLWAFPNPAYSHAQKDGALRDLCRAFAAALTDDEYADPLEKGYTLEEKVLPRLVCEMEAASDFLAPGSLPRLAALNCLAPFDAALHDAWGRALGGSTFRFYSADHLNADLAAYLGPDFGGRYPADYLLDPRRSRLGVQHVVGVNEPLTPADVAAHAIGPTSDVPAHLQAWIVRDGVTCFKVKLAGRNPAQDAARVAAVYTAATEAVVARGLSPNLVRLSIDPNEGYADVEGVCEMLDRLAADASAALAATDYLEQPIPRDLRAPGVRLHEIAARLPVIIDESLDSLVALDEIEPSGWSGLAVKVCKGQTASLLAYCWAKGNSHSRNLFVTLQDLTCPGLALVHSANLCARLDLAVDYFECNSRQYMPHACPHERAAHPDYFAVRNGYLSLPSRDEDGLY